MTNFDICIIALLPFSDERHLQNHINYLFRTDSRQKWTNCYTDRNLIIMGNTVYTTGKTLEKRKHTAAIVRNYIRHLKVDYKHLYMSCIECLDRDQDSYNDILITDVMNIMHDLDKELKMEDMRIIFAVTHEDQDNLHFHVICSKLPVKHEDFF